MRTKLLLLCLAALSQAAEPAKESPATPEPKPFFDPAAPAPTVDPTKPVPEPSLPAPEKKEKKKPVVPDKKEKKKVKK